MKLKAQLSTEARIVIGYILMGLILILSPLMLAPHASQLTNQTSRPSSETSSAQSLVNHVSRVDVDIRNLLSWAAALPWYWQLVLFTAMSAAGLASAAIGVWTLAGGDSRGWRGGTVGSVVAICAVLSLICFGMAALRAVSFLISGVRATLTIRPTTWQWYYQALLFGGLCIMALLSGLVTSVFGQNGDRGKRLVAGPIFLASAVSCAVTGIHFLMVGGSFALPLIQPAPLCVASAVALFGTLNANSVDRGAYSRCRTHEWRYVNGRRCKDATNRDVWEHLHGRGTWPARIKKQRIVWAIVAMVAGIFAACSVAAPGLPTEVVNSVGAAMAVTAISLIFKR